MQDKLTNTAGHSGGVDCSGALAGEDLVGVGMVGQLEALTAPVVELSPRHPLVNTEPAQCRFQLQPAGGERTVSKLGQLGLEVRTVSPPAKIKHFFSQLSWNISPLHSL